MGEIGKDQSGSGLEFDSAAQMRSSVRYYDIPGLLLFAMLALIVILQFLTRYVLNDSLAWTEEIARFLLLGVTFFGAVSLAARGEHIAVELIFRKAPIENTKLLALSVALFSGVYYAVLAVSAIVLALQTEQMLISVAIPKALVYAFLAIAIACCSGFCIARFFRLLTSRNALIAATYRDDGRQSEIAGD